jgi:hypothetical protein
MPGLRDRCQVIAGELGRTIRDDLVEIGFIGEAREQFPQVRFERFALNFDLESYAHGFFNLA